MARPSDYNQSIAETICEELAEGQSLKGICTRDDRPSQTSVFRWLARHGEFREMYARAREAQVEVYAAEIIDIADDGRNDTYIDEDGQEQVNNDVIQRSRLRVDSRKWLMSKLAPRKYGDRIEHVLKPARVEDMTDEELARIAGTGLLITSQVSPSQDETPPEYPENKGGGGVADG